LLLLSLLKYVANDGSTAILVVPEKGAKAEVKLFHSPSYTNILHCCNGPIHFHHSFL